VSGEFVHGVVLRSADRGDGDAAGSTADEAVLRSGTASGRRVDMGREEGRSVTVSRLQVIRQQVSRQGTSAVR
jgi:hypothetical protein